MSSLHRSLKPYQDLRVTVRPDGCSHHCVYCNQQVDNAVVVEDRTRYHFTGCISCFVQRVIGSTQPGTAALDVEEMRQALHAAKFALTNPISIEKHEQTVCQVDNALSSPVAIDQPPF